MILPIFCLIMFGTSACASNMGARRLTLMVVPQFFSVISSRGSFSATPALFTNTSIVPKAFSASAAACCGPSTVLMSASTATQRRPALVITALTSAKPALSRPTATISAPASANTTQASKPMPLVAPVTRMRLPFNPCRSVHALMMSSSFAIRFQRPQRPSDKHSVLCAGSAQDHLAGWHPNLPSTPQRWYCSP